MAHLDIHIANSLSFLFFISVAVAFSMSFFFKIAGWKEIEGETICKCLSLSTN